MSADFRAVMRGQFEDGQQRLADDPFATASGGSIIGRVRRKRTVNNVAVGGGTVLAAGALIVAAVQVPFGTLTPAASPSSCVTTTPAATRSLYRRWLRTRRAMSSTLSSLTAAARWNWYADGTGTLGVVFPDGSTTTVAPDRRSRVLHLRYA